MWVSIILGWSFLQPGNYSVPQLYSKYFGTGYVYLINHCKTIYSEREKKIIWNTYQSPHMVTCDGDIRFLLYFMERYVLKNLTFIVDVVSFKNHPNISVNDWWVWSWFLTGQLLSSSNAMQRRPFKCLKNNFAFIYWFSNGLFRRTKYYVEGVV